MARHCIFTDIMAILQHTASDPAFANHFAQMDACELLLESPSGGN